MAIDTFMVRIVIDFGLVAMMGYVERANGRIIRMTAKPATAIQFYPPCGLKMMKTATNKLRNRAKGLIKGWALSTFVF
jgi:hypothetical protein